MNALTIRALAGAGSAVLAVIVAASAAPLPVLAAVAAAMLAAALVAFSTQSRRLQDEQRLVYRPVPVRRHRVQRRVMTDFE